MSILLPPKDQEDWLPYFCHAAATLLFEGESRASPDSSDEPAESLTASTLAAYRSAWRDFEEWALERGQLPLPASGTDVARFLVARGDLTRSTLKKRRAAIGFVHRGLQLPSPIDTPEANLLWTVLNEKKAPPSPEVGQPRPDASPAATIETAMEKGLELLRERKGESPSGRNGEGERSPFSESALDFIPFRASGPSGLTEGQRTILPEPEYELGTLRDRAILLLGATGKLKRRELLEVRVEDIKVPSPDFDPGDVSLLVGIRRASGETALDWVLGLGSGDERRYDPARAVAAWIVAADLREGPLARSFTPQGAVRDKGMSPQALNQMIKQRARQAGLPASEWSAKTLKESP